MPKLEFSSQQNWNSTTKRKYSSLPNRYVGWNNYVGWQSFVLPAELFNTFSKISKHAEWKPDVIIVHVQ